MSRRLSHDECRARVCMLCFNKAKDMQRVTDNLHSLIERHAMTGYDRDDWRLPTAICGTCRSILIRKERGDCSAEIEVFDYSEIGALPRTRSQTSAGCECTICAIARSSINAMIAGSPKKRRGRPSAAVVHSDRQNSVRCAAPVSLKSALADRTNAAGDSGRPT
jgi:uncharacterized CHY-type Zn-finger protein